MHGEGELLKTLGAQNVPWFYFPLDLLTSLLVKHFQKVKCYLFWRRNDLVKRSYTNYESEVKTRVNKRLTELS